MVFFLKYIENYERQRLHLYCSHLGNHVGFHLFLDKIFKRIVQYCMYLNIECFKKSGTTDYLRSKKSGIFNDAVPHLGN